MPIHLLSLKTHLLWLRILVSDKAYLPGYPCRVYLVIPAERCEHHNITSKHVTIAVTVNKDDSGQFGTTFKDFLQ